MTTIRSAAKTRKPAERPVIQQSNDWIGQPVCAVLNDGRYYFGTVVGIQDGEWVITGLQGKGRISPDTGPPRAQVSGLFDSLLGGFGGMFGGGGAPAANAAGAAAKTGGFGFGGIMSTIRIGMSVMKMIIPLMGLFKI